MYQAYRSVAKLTDHAMGEVVKQISDGMSQYEIGDLIVSIGLKSGAESLKNTAVQSLKFRNFINNKPGGLHEETEYPYIQP